MMLLNKIMVFLGLALLAVLIIGNMTQKFQSYLFWMSSYSWIVAFFAAVIGAFIGFGLRGIIEGRDKKYEENNDFDF